MTEYLYRNLSELAGKRAVLMREEAQLWDILARDLKREAVRAEEKMVGRPVRMPQPAQVASSKGDVEEKLFVGILEAARMMGIGRSSLYNEINASRIKVRKCGRRTLIAVADIQVWFHNLPA